MSLSLGRVGLDFRPLLAPLFSAAAATQFAARVAAAAATAFPRALRAAPLVTHTDLPPASMTTATTTSTAAATMAALPSLRLLGHPPLAQLVNAVLTALNDLRDCAPVAACPAVCAALAAALHAAAAALADFHAVCVVFCVTRKGYLSHILLPH